MATDMKQSQYRVDDETARMLDEIVDHLASLGMQATKSAALRYSIRHTHAAVVEPEKKGRKRPK